MNVHDPAPGVVNAATATPTSSDDALPIYEVARQLGIAQHVLRTWENRFPQLQPIRGPSGRRLYRPADVQLLRRISDMLYVRHLSLGEVQRILAGPEGTKDIAGATADPAVMPQMRQPGPVAPTAVVEITDVQVEEIETVVIREQAIAPPAVATAPVPPVSPTPETAQAGVAEPPVEPAPPLPPVAVTPDVVKVSAAPEPAAPEQPAATPAENPPVHVSSATQQPQDDAAPASSAASPVESVVTEDVAGEGAEASAQAPDMQADASTETEEEPPLEQLVMLELERLRAENVVLRDHLRGVLVELEALREMVPV